MKNSVKYILLGAIDKLRFKMVCVCFLVRCSTSHSCWLLSLALWPALLWHLLIEARSTTVFTMFWRKVWTNMTMILRRRSLLIWYRQRSVY